MFDIELNEINEKLKAEEYIAEKGIEYAIFSAIKLKKPLLIDGPPGVGKTELAKVLSKMFTADMIRLQCYEGIDVSKVIYDINYPKQLLYQNILKENLTKALKGKDFKDSVEYLGGNTDFYGEEFLIERPLLQAINNKDKSNKVLLIDEIDKADLEVEAYLLETLSEYSVSIPEFGTVKADDDNIPLVVITSNNQRELSEALKRRCVYVFIDYPSIALESKIIETKAGANKDFADMVAKFVYRVRNEINLKQKPSIAESVEWANILFNTLGVNEISLKFNEEISMTLNVLSKNNKDLDKVKALFKREQYEAS